MFVFVMDALKYCFGIDRTKDELDKIRRKKQTKKVKRRRRPVIQRFVYINAPPPRTTTEGDISTIAETSV